MYACLKGQEKVAELLIAKGANLQHVDSVGIDCAVMPSGSPLIHVHVFVLFTGRQLLFALS